MSNVVVTPHDGEAPIPTMSGDRDPGPLVVGNVANDSPRQSAIDEAGPDHERP
ncbi:hypothetical protein [Mycobacterium nebraskense]|uniref:hypothetical protein n=1 Tax=Mycobacterium nebraskense TaxID=244292 RepID=UPI0012E039F7|nr:hypothetical protein [Mycobacterium nebraskense]MBI2694171.1 hypothetical protein [Mycobacterium nebraskense]MCV7119090.1 hypothetical protein [Mycobacterium nebraskense]